MHFFAFFREKVKKFFLLIYIFDFISIIFALFEKNGYNLSEIYLNTRRNDKKRKKLLLNSGLYDILKQNKRKRDRNEKIQIEDRA